MSKEHDVAAKHPDVVERIESFLAAVRTPSRPWPSQPRRAKGKQDRQRGRK